MVETSALTPIEDGKKAAKLDPRQLMQRALRAAGRGIKTGRVTSSFPGESGKGNVKTQLDALYNQYAPLAYNLPWEVLEYVDLLATYNPDYSQAVENIKMLANSGHEVFVDAESDLQKKRIKDGLELMARTVQESHGGVDGVINKLLDQGAVFGAMCGEWVLNDELTEVVDFVDLSPKKIRFFWDEQLQVWAPYQVVNGKQLQEARKNGQEVRGTCVRLNTETFCYYAFDAAPDVPYGTPPFLAALTNIAIQRDIVHNLAQIVKKIGLLGMVDVSIERLDPLPGESEVDYAARAGSYLDDYVDVAEEMVRDGGLVHFDDVKTTMQQLGGNAAGATNIHKANEELLMSGLKSMPSVQGRSYSTTETYAGVAYDIIIRNTYKYQNAVKRVIERGYWLQASMQGMRPTKISLHFNENRSLNRLQEAQSEAAEIRNQFMLWVMGIIDQNDAAQNLGYSQPKTPMEEPPDSIDSGASSEEPEGSGSNQEGDGNGSETSRVSDFSNAGPTSSKMEESDDEQEPED